MRNLKRHRWVQVQSLLKGHPMPNFLRRAKLCELCPSIVERKWSATHFAPGLARRMTPLFLILSLSIATAQSAWARPGAKWVACRNLPHHPERNPGTLTAGASPGLIAKPSLFLWMKSRNAGLVSSFCSRWKTKTILARLPLFEVF